MTFRIRRSLIGALLLLNALPFTLNRSNRLFFGGLIFLCLGLLVLSGPLPADRRFTILDGVRWAAAAAMLCMYLMFYGREPSMLLSGLFALCALILVIPWRISGQRKRRADDEK